MLVLSEKELKKITEIINQRDDMTHNEIYEMCSELIGSKSKKRGWPKKIWDYMVKYIKTENDKMNTKVSESDLKPLIKILEDADIWKELGYKAHRYLVGVGKKLNMLDEIKTTLARLIQEEYKKILNEVNVTDPELQRQIDELAEIELLSQELDDRLKGLKARKLAIENTLRPFLTELRDLKRNYLRTEQYIVYIAKAGEEARKSVSYKDGFNIALTKVNEATRKVLNDALEATATFAQVQSLLGISTPDALAKARKKQWNLDDEGNEIEESLVLENWKEKLKTAWTKFKSVFIKKTDALESVNTSLERLNLQLANYVQELKMG